MYKLPSLPYDYSDLSPYIDEETMRIHHDKHHQGYIDKLNTALETHPDLANTTVESLLVNIETLPSDIKTAVQNHGGGHANHTFFWEIMRPGRVDNAPDEGELVLAINDQFGDAPQFKEKFINAGLGHFGSGWVWLVVNKTGALEIITTPNQNSPVSLGLKPVIGADVWEHAYYLKYQNRRVEYLENFFAVINWAKAEENFKQAKI